MANVASQPQEPPQPAPEPVSNRGRVRREQNACDACRARKVKCQYDRSLGVCFNCQKLEIECRRNRPRKKRGPPNEYLRSRGFQSRSSPLQQLQQHNSLHISSFSVVSTSPTSSLSSDVNAFDLTLCLPGIREIITDWVTWVYPLAPIVHQASIWAALDNPVGSYDPGFISLLASICATTITSLKNKSYPDITVQQCMDLSTHPDLWGVGGVYTLRSCQSMYNFSSALIAIRGLDDADVFRLRSQVIAGVKYLVHYQMSKMDFVSQELLKRLYWVLFAGQCTIDMLGRPFVDLLSPNDNIKLLMPVEVADTEFSPSQITDPSFPLAEFVSYIPGINHLSRLYLIWYNSQQKSLDRLTHLSHYLQLAQRGLDSLPPELRWRGGLSRHPAGNLGTELQVVNLHITQLHIRSNLLEQIYALCTRDLDLKVLETVHVERNLIVEDVLEILYHMEHRVLDAYHISLIPKIRDIGGILLDKVYTDQLNEEMGSRASTNLKRLIANLESLDTALF